MILKGSQRGGGYALARHLLNRRDNDIVEVRHVSGFITRDPYEAFLEVEAIAKATRCRQPFFSVSLSPPLDASPVPHDFDDAVAQIEEKLGLAGQPKALIFHEKKGRWHAHCVWSRITPDVRSVNLPYFKNRLTEISRELYLSHGWTMPKGLQDPSFTDPRNFTLEEWQVAHRADREPREIKAVLKQCWKMAGSAKALSSALQERGFALAKGDRRGFVALDFHGNVYSLSRWLDVKAKDLTARLGDPGVQPSVQEAKSAIDANLGSLHAKLSKELEDISRIRLSPHLLARQRTVATHRMARENLSAQARQQYQELVARNHARFRRGLAGLWQWVSGQRRAFQREFQLAMDAFERESHAKQHGVRTAQIAERSMQNKELAREVEIIRQRRRSLDVSFAFGVPARHDPRGHLTPENIQLENDLSH